MSVKILRQEGHRFLWIDGYLWMTDIGPEVSIQRELAKKARGDVLVAGYGLGVLQGMLMKNPEVNRLLTIENNIGVMQACKEEDGRIVGEWSLGDFFDFTTNASFDTIIGDVWEEIDEVFLPEYVKYKKKAQQLLKPDGQILAWGGGYFEYLLEKR